MVRWHVSRSQGILNNYSVAAAVILMYDIFLTFGEEVTRVWGSRRSLGKWLFLVHCATLPPAADGLLDSFFRVRNTYVSRSSHRISQFIVFSQLYSFSQRGSSMRHSMNFVVIIGIARSSRLSYSEMDSSSTSASRISVYRTPDLTLRPTSVVIMAISVANLVIWILAPISMAYLATSLMRCLQVTVCSRLLLNIRGMLEPKYGTKNFTMSSFKVRTAPTPMADPVQNDSYDVNDSGGSFAVATHRSSIEEGCVQRRDRASMHPDLELSSQDLADIGPAGVEEYSRVDTIITRGGV
ncbi:hypothetical protein BDZ89DRAFT_1134294 [Hymenopellis radicata]|nr:hypothetical protein BDZ89DRAFT_1134294 [Hymenopellis radicata]